MTGRQGDRGFTLIELLVVIVVVGILATVVVAATVGFSGDAKQSSCVADAHVLQTAAEAYFAQKATNMIPLSGSGPDNYELVLVDAGFLREPSTYYDIDQWGALTPANDSPCSA